MLIAHWGENIEHMEENKSHYVCLCMDIYRLPQIGMYYI